MLHVDSGTGPTVDSDAGRPVDASGPMRASDGGAMDATGPTGIVPGGIRWLGRVDASNPAAVKLAWSGAGLVATVSGAKISVRLQTEGATTSAFFQPVIDGAPGARFQVMTGAMQTAVLADGLSDADHTVELYRESEGMYGDTVFGGFADGVVKGAPAASGRLLEIIGDSISAGYGNLGNEAHPPWDNTCTFSLDTESAYQAYGAVLARTLGAELSIIARSGWGMYRDLGGSTTGVLSSVYANTLGTTAGTLWNFTRQPDAVVINLGTNDSGLGDPGQPYEDAYVAFLHTVRGHYPNAWVFLTIGPMTSDPLLSQMKTHITNVVMRMSDAKITSVDMAVQDATSTGCDYHPNVAEDKTIAATLASAMRSKLGW
jgi:hypothetical protein